jgi:hypothetical protein
MGFFMLEQSLVLASRAAGRLTEGNSNRAKPPKPRKQAKQSLAASTIGDTVQINLSDDNEETEFERF